MVLCLAVSFLSFDCASHGCLLMEQPAAPIAARLRRGNGACPSAEVLAYLFDDSEDLQRLLDTSLGPGHSGAKSTAAAALLDLQAWALDNVKTAQKRRALVDSATKFSHIYNKAKQAKTLPALEFTQGWLAKSGASKRIGQWKSRRVRKLAIVQSESTRADTEAKELLRWRSELAELVAEADLPITEAMSQARDREAILLGALGSARASTICKRIRERRKARAFCLAVTGSHGRRVSAFCWTTCTSGGWSPVPGQFLLQS